MAIRSFPSWESKNSFNSGHCIRHAVTSHQPRFQKLKKTQPTEVAAGAAVVVLVVLMFLVTSMATTIAMMITITRMMKKQIQRFLRAARAESTAFEVYCKLFKLRSETSALSSGRHEPNLRVLFYSCRLSFNGIYCLVLLFNEDAHLIKTSAKSKNRTQIGTNIVE